MRWSVRHELASMTTVLAAPLAVVLAFPFAAVDFRAAPDRAERPVGAAFVVLTEAQERAALAAAKASWQGGSEVRRLRTNLAVGELPDEAARPVLDVCDRPSASDVKPVAYVPGGLAPSVAADRPRRIGTEKTEATTPAFSREELLKID